MDPWSEFAESIFAINALLMQAGEGISRPIGQSPARWQVLGQLGHGPKTVAEMARNIGNARQSVQRVADVLAGEGLVAGRDKPDDKRTQLLALTEAGMAVLMAIYERQVAWSAQVTGRLDAEQLAEVTRRLREIGDIVRSVESDGADEAAR